MRLTFKVNNHLRYLSRQALTGSQVKRHTGPAPVVDFGFDRHKRFGFAYRIGVIFLKIARHFLAFNKTSGVLTAYGHVINVAGIDWAQGFKYF